MENMTIDQKLHVLAGAITDKLLALESIARTHGGDWPNWGHVGDLNYLNDRLDEIIKGQEI